MSTQERVDRAGDVAALFDGRRLTLARHLAGIRKNALAEAIGKTATAVASYENGTKRPARATVTKLAIALAVDSDFFLPGPSDFPASAGAPHFRSLRSTTQISRDQAYAYGRLVVAVAAVLERHVELPDRAFPLSPLSPDEEYGDHPEEGARLLRKAWGIEHGPVRHLVRAAENHGILVVFGPQQTAAVDAYSFDNSHRPVITMNPLKGDYYRQRFDVAHELGHLVMHCDAEPGGRVVEEQAHRFAAEFLLPAEDIAEALPSRADWPRLARLKEQWGVSLQALLFRARRLSVMSETTYKNAMQTLSARGWRRQEPGSDPVIEQPSLLPRAVEVLSGAGISDRRLAREARVPLRLFLAVTSRYPDQWVSESPADEVDVDSSAGMGVLSVLRNKRGETDEAGVV